MSDRPVSPFQLAVLLHYEPDEARTAPGAVGHRPVVDHWLRQLGHFDPLFASEYMEAPSLLAELLVAARTPAERLDAIDRDERFHNWGFCRHLLCEVEAAAATSAALAGEWSELAVAVARHLDADRYHPAWTADLRARSWCALAAARARLGEDADARAAARAARRQAAAGTGCPALASRVAETEARIQCREDQPRTETPAAARGEPPAAEPAQPPTTLRRAAPPPPSRSRASRRPSGAS